MKRLFSKAEWKSVAGASHKPKRLKLNPDQDGLYTCPIPNCDTSNYKSQRGCRKHVYVKHAWFYYFDTKPNVEEAFSRHPARPPQRKARRSRTWDMLSFSEECGWAKEFVSWICSAGGGGKDASQAQQICKKILKFCKYCCKSLDDDYELTNTVVEYCVGSVDLVQKFTNYLVEQCELGNPGVISYLQSLSHCLDYVRFKGLTPEKIGTMLTTEVFLSRAKQCSRKKMRVEWNTVLSIEHLESMNCWATLTDLQSVLPFHEKRFAQVINLAKGNAYTPHDLTFATSFLVTVMFLKVKGSRPMTYQFLTLEMTKSAFRNGIIDQSHFKTEEKYGFDSLVFSDYVVAKARDYVGYVRPHLNPACKFLFLCKKGQQLANLGDIFGRMVYQAIGKHVNPTRYRQIIETASLEFLSPKDQETISLDQKHTSNVAKVHYQKHRSRETARKAVSCMDKLIRSSRQKQGASCSKNVSENVETTSESSHREVTLQSDTASDSGAVDTVFVPAVAPPTTRTSARKAREAIPSENIQKNLSRKKKNPFTKEEDSFLLKGLKKYGHGKWTHILQDPHYKFHSSRKNSTLMMRAKAKRFI